jgi:hypothetical protein
MRQRPAHARRAAAATELAITLPFIVLLFMVAVDYCRVYYYTQTLQNAAYSAALYGSGNAQPLIDTPVTTAAGLATVRAAAAAQAAITEASSLNPPLTTQNVQLTISNGVATATVTYACPMLTPVLGTSGTVTLTRQAVMTVAR